MMVQTLIPCSPASKTEEILSRYRPIAPKPEINANTSDGIAVEDPPLPTHKIKHSPYLRNIWANLQARPTRARKRGRGSIAPASLKRPHKIAQAPFLGLYCPSPLSFISHNLMQEKPLTLPLLSPCSSSSSQSPPAAIDLNSPVVGQPLEEKDLILQLKPCAAPHVIIAPKAIRPIGSTIRVGPIRANHRVTAGPKKLPAEKIEAEVEEEELPAVVTDSNNKVRMVNSAYKELVGQPECRWLDSLTASVAGRRISGEVMLQMPPSGPDLLNGFSCWAKIEWGQEYVDAFCDVGRLCCGSKDYLFSWRFHTKQAMSSS